MRLINEAVVTQAVALGLADPKVVVADMTAQEAGIPHPNEMGLLSGFVRSIEAAAGKAGQRLKAFLSKAGGKLKAAKEQVRKYRLFAKDKTKKVKDQMVAQMANIVEGINQQMGKGGKHWRRPDKKGASCAVMPWSRAANSASYTRRWPSSCRRFVTGCAPVSSLRARSSICTSRSCIRSCAARLARPSSSDCPGASRG